MMAYCRYNTIILVSMHIQLWLSVLSSYPGPYITCCSNLLWIDPSAEDSLKGKVLPQMTLSGWEKLVMATSLTMAAKVMPLLAV